MKERCEFWATWLLIQSIQLMPLCFARKVSGMFAWSLNTLFGIRTDVIEANLKRAFPEHSDEDITELRNECYNFFAVASVDWLKMDDVLDQESIYETGWENLEQFSGEGTILVTAHFGYWELTAVKVAERHGELSVYAERQSNTRSDDFIRRHREHYGIRSCYDFSGIRTLLDKLSAGRYIGILNDQREGNNFHWVPFFSRAVKTPRILPFLARKSQAPVVPISAYRIDDGIKLQVFEPLESSLHTMNDEDDEVDLLMDYHEWLESEIKKHPEQYFWFHRKFKNSRPVS